jgi:hypothetical protein
MRLTTSSQVGNKVLGCVCAGSMLLLAEDESTRIIKRRPCWSVIKPVRITFSRIVYSSPDRLNLGFLLREKTCCCAHHTFRLEFPNCLDTIIINYTPDISSLAPRRRKFSRTGEPSSLAPAYPPPLARFAHAGEGGR